MLEARLRTSYMTLSVNPEVEEVSMKRQIQFKFTIQNFCVWNICHNSFKLHIHWLIFVFPPTQQYFLILPFLFVLLMIGKVGQGHFSRSTINAGFQISENLLLGSWRSGIYFLSIFFSGFWLHNLDKAIFLSWKLSTKQRLEGAGTFYWNKKVRFGILAEFPAL